MILSTTPKLDGKTIKEYKGLVFGETILGANIFKDFLANVRDVIGGRSDAYERVLMEAREAAISEMSQRAKILGCNAIIGINVDYEVVGHNGSMLMVNTSGTAVVVE